MTTYRPNAVTGSVLTATDQAPPLIVQKTLLPTALIPRPDLLRGETYKIKWPESAHAVYVTINDAEIDGQRRPFEIFINSKNMEHYAWTLGLTRMISAVFRRGGDVSFVAEELKAVFDPRGGGWINGRYVPSLLAAIGGVIERHLAEDGVRAADAGAPDLAAPAARPSPACPRCGGQALLRKEGCDTCMDCGYSKCG
jgi:ribonucleoside-diphosphate reductase alpha chain